MPTGVELAAMPSDGPSGGRPSAGTDRVEFVVLAPTGGDRLAGMLPAMPRLRVVQTLNAGVDWVPELPSGVTLCNASGVHDGPVAEWVLAGILASYKRLPHYLDHQRSARWDSSGNLAFGGGPAADDLSGATVLVVGYGSIGAAVEARLAPFGAHVLRVARHGRPGVHEPSALADLLPDADIVVLLAPATTETAGLVDERFLAALRPGALVVNASRGSLVDTDALLAALAERRVRAVLDATDPEPLPDGHPLWTAPGLIITPHVAGSSARWFERACAFAGEQIRRYAMGEPLSNVRAHGY
ncbi:MAG: 2-hydroxyacid dehydrogenase [bacterium]